MASGIHSNALVPGHGTGTSSGEPVSYNDYSGMEVQAIRALARTMESRADEIDGLVAQATSEVHGLTWRGNDRERFVREWDGTHASQLRRTAQGLREAAGHAWHKAAEQERISRAD